ncbi:hypothetical protein Dimus_003999 [Dionaea muscipula]
MQGIPSVSKYMGINLKVHSISVHIHDRAAGSQFSFMLNPSNRQWIANQRKFGMHRNKTYMTKMDDIFMLFVL